MTDTLAILRQRRSRRLHNRRSTEGRTLRAALGIGFVLSALLAIGFLAAAFAYAEITRDLPSLDQLPSYLDPQNGTLLQPTRIYDRSGTIILTALEAPDAPRRYLFLDANAPGHFSPEIARTVVATLDPGYWSHAGYTSEGLTDPDSHPTLTQKLVFDLLLADEPATPRRAIRERILAAQVTSRFGREQVLEWYLNSANFGRYAYGTEAAAQLYFGKSAEDVNLAEAALLVAALESPALNPMDSPQAASQRQLEIIQALSVNGVIAESEAAVARASEVDFRPPVEPQNLSPAFTNLVLNQLETKFSRSRIERGGLDIITTLEYPLQLQTACAVHTQLNRLQGDNRTISTADGSPCTAANLLPPIPPGEPEQAAAANALVLDPETGQVLALVGEQVDGGSETGLGTHPAGTLLSPFIYLTGFTRGLSPASLLWDVPGGLSGDLPDIQNPDGQYHGPLRARIALVNDYLASTAQVSAQMGTSNLLRTLQSFGINAPGLSDPDALISGDVDISPLTLAHAFGIFATEGVQYGQPVTTQSLQPTSVLRVETVDHAIWLDWTQPHSAQIVSPQLAYLVNNALSDDAARAPSLGSPTVLKLERPAAAKIGITPDQSGVWTVGYTPQRVTLVWMRADAPLTPRITGGLWAGLMLQATRNLPPLDWRMPPGVTVMDVCDPSGFLPTSDCPNIAREVFLNGNEPTQADNLYQPFDINIETGFLATVFTPPELVERRVYLVVPPAARDWAAAAGLKTPPEAYDTIQARPKLPEAHITSPGMFGNLYGTVPIIGSAGGENFQYYRLQYGQGLNPQEWFQIGDNTIKSVEENVLAEWDTSQLNGLYALRLQVVSTDQTVLSDTIQVSIDNIPPEVSIAFPRDGETYSAANYPEMTLQISVSDNFLLDKVDVYLNSLLLKSFSEPSYSVTWPPTVNSHTLRLVATDRSGNQTEKVIHFTVSQ